VFKSWFGRKPSTEGTAQHPSTESALQPSDPDVPLSVSGQPVPRLVLAGDQTALRRPTGPHLPIKYRGPAIVLTSEVETISSAALQAAIRRRAPQIHFPDGPLKEPQKAGDRPTALGNYPDVVEAFDKGRQPLLYGISYFPSINLQGMDKRSFVTSCWWWPETREVVARTKAHAVSVTAGNFDQAPPKERILLEMQVVAAALDVLKSATAVIWPDADAMWKPDMFRFALKQAKGEIPTAMAVAVKVGNDTENLRADGKPKLFARTEGLHAFGMMEAEWRAFDGPVIKLATWISGLVWYLIKYGPIVAHEDSMGCDTPGVMPNFVIRHEPSTTVLGTQAYVIYPQSQN
jgi:hypothetical protein